MQARAWAVVAPELSQDDVLLDPAATDAIWSQMQRLRSETIELKAQLSQTEIVSEERLREMQKRCDQVVNLREYNSKDDRASAKQEVDRLTRKAADAEERARRSDEGVLQLLGESQEAANLMQTVTIKFEKQVGISESLKRKLQRSEAETDTLRSELEAVLRREATKIREHDCAEATIQAIMPRLTEEAKVEALAAEEAQDAKQRLKRAESMFNAQATDLLGELRQSREEQAAWGRRYDETCEVASIHVHAGHQWQQRTRAAEEELIRAGYNQHHLWEAARRTRAVQFAQEERMREAEEQRDRAMYNNVVANQAHRELSSWVVSSLDEVNRSAHMQPPTGAPKSGNNQESFKGHAWVDMLESFRQDQQTRSGHGARMRGPH